MYVPNPITINYKQQPSLIPLSGVGYMNNHKVYKNIKCEKLNSVNPCQVLSKFLLDKRTQVEACYDIIHPLFGKENAMLTDKIYW